MLYFSANKNSGKITFSILLSLLKIAKVYKKNQRNGYLQTERIVSWKITAERKFWKR